MILHTIAPRGLPRGVLFSIHEKFGVARDFREPCFFRAVERVSENTHLFVISTEQREWRNLARRRIGYKLFCRVLPYFCVLYKIPRLTLGMAKG